MSWSHHSSQGFLDLCVTSIFSVTELWDVPSLKLASPSLLSLWGERSQNGLDPVRAISVAVIAHIYVGIFKQRDAHKRERAACVCHPGGYNLFLAFLGLNSADRSESRFLLAFLLLPHAVLAVIALSYVLWKIEDSSLGKVIYAQDISSWAFLFLFLQPASRCLFVCSSPTCCCHRWDQTL